MTARERLSHLFDKWDRVHVEFVEDRKRERMVRQILEADHADESRPE